MCCIQTKHLRGRAVKLMDISFILQGILGSILRDVNFFSFFFSRFSLIPSQSASLYIIESFEVYLIAENNYPHVLVVLFQKSSTVQYILTPSIFDMPLLYSISSLKSMSDMRGSSNFRLRGGEGGGGQNLTEKGFVNFLVLKLIYSGFNVLNLFTVGSTVTLLYFLVQKGVQHFPGVGVELNCLIPVELVIFKLSPGHLSPPTSSLGLCTTDPSQNDRVTCLNHELC